MRWIIFKVISFFSVFIFMQTSILPWAISTNFIPLWADIILISIMLMMSLTVIDRMANRLIILTRRKDSAATE